MAERSKKKISVVIPVYNGSRTLRKTLQTVKSQNDFEMETIVVDDASTENIRDLVEELGARYVRLKKNAGPGTARTEGAKVAEGEIILFTDSDVWLPDNLLSVIRKDFEEQGCECVQGTFSKKCPFGNFFSQYKNLYNRYVLGLLGPWIDTTYTSVTAVDKEFFFKSGGFDLNIRGASVEDRSLGESLIQAGGRIYLDHDLEVVHNKKLTARGFYRNQFRRSRDLAKLRERQKESGFLAKGRSFGTNSKKAMLRLPVAWSMVGCLVLFLGTLAEGFLIPIVPLGLVYATLTKDWIGYLRKEKGTLFALRGWVVDFTDAMVTAVGVGAGLLEYRVKGREY